MLFGFTTSFRMGQLLRYSLVIPDHDPRVPVEKYMATAFINAVRECLKANGAAKATNGVEEGGTFLVGYQGRLFRIEGDYQVGETTNGYDACGCGQDLARGSMFSTKSRGKARDRIVQALKAAEYHSAGVCGPFKILATSTTQQRRRT